MKLGNKFSTKENYMNYKKMALMIGLAFGLTGAPRAEAFNNLIETNHPLVPRDTYLLRTCMDFINTNSVVTRAITYVNDSRNYGYRQNITLDHCIQIMDKNLSKRPNQALYFDRELFQYVIGKSGNHPFEHALNTAFDKMFFPNDLQICFPNGSKQSLDNYSLNQIEVSCLQRIQRDIPQEFLAVTNRDQSWAQIETEMANIRQRLAQEAAAAEVVRREQEAIRQAGARLTEEQRQAAAAERQRLANERAAEAARQAREKIEIAATERREREAREAAEKAEQDRLAALNSFPNRMRRYSAQLSGSDVGIGVGLIVGGEVLRRSVEPLTTSRLFTSGSSGLAINEAQAARIVDGIDRLERSTLSRYLPGELSGGEVTFRADFSVVDSARGAQRVSALANVGGAGNALTPNLQFREIAQPAINIVQPVTAGIAQESILTLRPDLSPGTQIPVDANTLAQRVDIGGPAGGSPVVTQTQGLFGGTTAIVNTVDPPEHPAVAVNNPGAIAEAKKLLAEMEARFAQLRLELSSQMNQEQLALQERIAITRASLATLEGQYTVNERAVLGQIASADAERYGRVVAAQIANLQSDMQSIEEMSRAAVQRGNIYRETAPTFTERSFRLSRWNGSEAVAAELADLTATGAVVREIRWTPVVLQRGLQILGRGVSVLGAVQLGSELLPPAFAGEVCSGGVNCYSRDAKNGENAGLGRTELETQEVIDGR